VVTLFAWLAVACSSGEGSVADAVPDVTMDIEAEGNPETAVPFEPRVTSELTSILPLALSLSAGETTFAQLADGARSAFYLAGADGRAARVVPTCAA
jgi:hypothetical protein